MFRRSWVGLLLSFLLGMAGIILLFLISLPDTSLSLPDSTSIISLIVILILLIFVAVSLITREVLRRVWQNGFDAMRVKALEEHQRFLNRLDHELKNPLTALRAGLASLALTLKDEQQRQIVQTLADEGQRLSQLVTDLRKLAELDAVTLDLQPISVDDLCRHFSALIEERCAGVNRQLHIGCPPERDEHPLIVIADTDLLLLAVHNLLDNAIKYTRFGDEISFSVVTEQEKLLISVRDTGIGIPVSEQDLVWEELYRGKNAAGIRGSGIGLALVKMIIEHHNGFVSLQSRLGYGTLVTLSLPLR